jgi:hypothetical protein
VVQALEHPGSEHDIAVPEPVRTQALGCIERMLDFVAQQASVAPRAVPASEAMPGPAGLGVA